MPVTHKVTEWVLRVCRIGRPIGVTIKLDGLTTVAVIVNLFVYNFTVLVLEISNAIYSKKNIDSREIVIINVWKALLQKFAPSPPNHVYSKLEHIVQKVWTNTICRFEICLPRPPLCVCVCVYDRSAFTCMNTMYSLFCKIVIKKKILQKSYIILLCIKYLT